MNIDLTQERNINVKITLLNHISNLKDLNGISVWANPTSGDEAADIVWFLFDRMPDSNAKLTTIFDKFPIHLVKRDTEKRKYGRSISIIRHLNGQDYTNEIHTRDYREKERKGIKEIFNCLLYIDVYEWDTKKTIAESTLISLSQRTNLKIASFLQIQSKVTTYTNAQQQQQILINTLTNRHLRADQLEQDRVIEANAALAEATRLADLAKAELNRLADRAEYEALLEARRKADLALSNARLFLQQIESHVAKRKRLARHAIVMFKANVQSKKLLREKQVQADREKEEADKAAKDKTDQINLHEWDNARTEILVDAVYQSIDSLKMYVNLKQSLDKALKEYSATMVDQQMTDQATKDMFDGMINSLAAAVPPPFTPAAQQIAGFIRGATKVDKFVLDPRNREQLDPTTKQSDFDHLVQKANKLVDDLAKNSSLKVGAQTNNKEVHTTKLHNQLSSFHQAIEENSRLRFKKEVDSFFGITRDQRIEAVTAYMNKHGLTSCNDLVRNTLMNFCDANPVFTNRKEQIECGVPKGIELLIELHLYCLHITCVLQDDKAEEEEADDRIKTPAEKVEVAKALGLKLTAFATGSLVGDKITDRLKHKDIGLLSPDSDSHTYSTKTTTKSGVLSKNERQVTANEEPHNSYGTMKYIKDDDHVRLLAANCMWIKDNINPFVLGLRGISVAEVIKYRKEYIDAMNGCVIAGKENSMMRYFSEMRFMYTTRTAFWDWEKIETGRLKINLKKLNEVDFSNPLLPSLKNLRKQIRRNALNEDS
jgi:hypothetical protein